MNPIPVVLSRRRSAPWIALIVILALAPAGCESTRKVAGHGHDLLENPGRSALVRLPAAVGAMAGYTVGIPIAAVVWPAAFFEEAFVKSASQGDIWISPLLASFDYGSGTGAAVLGEPFNLIRKAFAEEPPVLSPGEVPETPEGHPAEPDPELDFAVRPWPVLPDDTAPGSPGPDAATADSPGDTAPGAKGPPAGTAPGA